MVKKNRQEGKAGTLSQVLSRSSFSRVLLIIKDLYAEDIANDISFDDAANIVIKEALLHP